MGDANVISSRYKEREDFIRTLQTLPCAHMPLVFISRFIVCRNAVWTVILLARTTILFYIFILIPNNKVTDFFVSNESFYYIYIQYKSIKYKI